MRTRKEINVDLVQGLKDSPVLCLEVLIDIRDLIKGSHNISIDRPE